MCVLVNNNLCGKLALLLESPIKFEERFKVARQFYVKSVILSHFILILY